MRSLIAVDTSGKSCFFLIDLLAMVSIPDNLARTVAVNAEGSIWGLSVPLDLNIHQIGTRLEGLEFNMRISQSISAYFLLTACHDFVVSWVHIFHTSPCFRILHLAESNINLSRVIVQIEWNAVGLLHSAAPLGHSEGGGSIAVLQNFKLKESVSSLGLWDGDE